MAKAIKQAEKELQEEGLKQLDLVTGSCILALYRYWGWKTERLSRVLEIQEEVYAECGKNNDMSMIRLLDEECDIELKNREDVSYRDVIYLNSDIDNGEVFDGNKWLIMRKKQKSWIECQITACICLAMHRKEGWGFKRLRELMEHMQDIKEEFNYDPKLIVSAVEQEAHYNWTGNMEVQVL